MEQWREELVEILHYDDFYAEAVPTAELALQKLQRSFYHLLILDIELTSINADGFALLRELERLGLSETVKVVMLSSQETPSQKRRAFRISNVIGFLTKDAFDSQSFLDYVHDLFAHEMSLNLDLHIRWSSSAEEDQLLQDLRDDSVLVSDLSINALKLEMEDLLFHLFHRATSIMLHAPLPMVNNQATLWAQPFYATGAGRTVVLKFTSRSQVKKELRYIQQYISRSPTSIITDTCCTARLGVISYTLPENTNDQPEDFTSS
jgi:CheY-like chemotaxis protein